MTESGLEEQLVFSWIFKKSAYGTDLRQSKDLLSSLVQKGASRVVGEADVQPNQNSVASGRADAISQEKDRKAAPSMFDYLEKKTHKRLFYNYLRQFELTLEHLGSRVSRQLVNMVHDESCKVAHAFNEPLVSVSHNIISAAAWGTIYCLLGPERMCQLHPEYCEIIEEVEMELMGAGSELVLENSVYQHVFTILCNNSLCHPDVIALSEACKLSETLPVAREIESAETELAQLSASA